MDVPIVSAVPCVPEDVVVHTMEIRAESRELNVRWRALPATAGCCVNWGDGKGFVDRAES